MQFLHSQRGFGVEPRFRSGCSPNIGGIMGTRTTWGISSAFNPDLRVIHPTSSLPLTAPLTAMFTALWSSRLTDFRSAGLRTQPPHRDWHPPQMSSIQTVVDPATHATPTPWPKSLLARQISVIYATASQRQFKPALEVTHKTELPVSTFEWMKDHWKRLHARQRPHSDDHRFLMQAQTLIQKSPKHTATGKLCTGRPRPISRSTSIVHQDLPWKASKSLKWNTTTTFLLVGIVEHRVNACRISRTIPWHRRSHEVGIPLQLHQICLPALSMNSFAGK